MKMVKTFVTGMAALSFVAAPLAAQAADASKLSLTSHARASAMVAGERDDVADYVIPGGIAVAVILGIILVTGGNGETTSP